MATTAIPGGAACYFCLGEEGDDEGNSLVRDCSCRGNSGFAHLSCLAKYAEQKCRAADDGDLPSIREPWSTCNNCKQPFQGQLAIDLACAFVSFAEATYGQEGNSKWDKMRVISALRLKIESLNTSNRMLFTEDIKEACNKLLSMINQTKKDLNMNRWIHKPRDSEEYQYYKVLCGLYEAYAHEQLGAMFFRDSFEEDFSAMITNFKKARAIYNLVGMNDDAQQMDTFISLCTDSPNKQAANDGDASSSTRIHSTLEAVRNIYQRNLHTNGMDSACTIRSGVLYASVLRRVNRIEAERIITKLSTISCRVHGPDHKVTVEAVKLLEECKERYVLVLPDDKVFQALQYENDGEICVVTGPITEPRNKADKRMYHIANKLVIPNIGCPVICHGLVSASHLNGELGEVRNKKQDGTGLRLAVRFEKKGVKSALVKPANLRIVFDLSSEVSQFLNIT
jgi:hypothetical protein